MDGLVLVNINPSAEGLMDSVASKVSSIYTHNVCRIRSTTISINVLLTINKTSCIDDKAKMQWRCVAMPIFVPIGHKKSSFYLYDKPAT